MKKIFGAFGAVALVLLLGGASCISFQGNSGASGPVGMFASEDKGDSWKQISLFPTADGLKTLSDTSVYRLSVDPQDPNALYWLSREHGFFYTYDHGRTWRQPDSGPLATGFVYALAVDPKNKCNIYATNGGYVYHSTDCSRSWREVYRESRSDTRAVALAFNPFNTQQIFLAESGGDLLVSRDNGVSWDVVHRFQVPVVNFYVDPFTPDILYVLSRQNGLFRSEDGGVNWITRAHVFDDYSGALQYRRFLVHPTKPNTLYWISTYGILVSHDRGDTWLSIDLITPPGSAQIYAFAVNPKNDQEMYYTATINNRSTFYRTSDGGKTWITKKMPSGQVPTALYVHPQNGSLVYLGFTQLPQ